MTTGRALAAALLCDGASAARACGTCRACGLVSRGYHPDLHLVVPTPPERNPRGPRAIRIGDVRELERQASLRPALGTRQVFVLDDADRMTEDTPQAFLKTLEEPPSRTVIVLILATVRSVPATVISRCQVVRFAARPDGGAAARRAEARAVFAEIRAKGPEALLGRLPSIDRERAEGLVDAYWWLCRDLLITRAGAPPRLLVNRTPEGEVAREAERWSLCELLEEIGTCREAREALLTNVSPRLTLEVVLGRLAGKAA
jgi:DNA polymerase-3 subunit delta'